MKEPNKEPSEHQPDRKLLQQFYNAPTRKYKKGEIIFTTDMPPKYIYCSESGFVINYTLSVEGVRNSHNINRPKTIFPFNFIGHEQSPKNSKPHILNTIFYEAMSDIEVRQLSIKELDEAANDDPEILQSIILQMAFEIELYMRRIDSLTQPDAYHSVAFLLYEFGVKFGRENKDGGITIEAPITHQHIASFLLISRETASRELSRLEQADFIKKHNSLITINNLNKLKELIV